MTTKKEIHLDFLWKVKKLILLILKSIYKIKFA